MVCKVLRRVVVETCVDCCPAILVAMGEEMLEKVERRFPWDAMVDRMQQSTKTVERPCENNQASRTC